MKTVKLSHIPVFQGDVMVTIRPNIPTESVLDASADRAIVAHSETGHHHLAFGPLDFYRNPAEPRVTYARASGSFELRHLRDWDTHESIVFDVPDGGAYVQFDRQEEWTPEGWQEARD